MRLLRDPLKGAGASRRAGASASLACALALAISGAPAWASSKGPPSNGKPPAIPASPAPREGRTTRAKIGTWSGVRPIDYSYVWLRCDSEGESCVEVAATTRPAYMPRLEDVGHTLRVVVTAVNNVGTTSATSEPSVPVKPAPPKKERGAVITGEPKDGQLLSATSGTWKGTPPFTYTYQWQQCNRTQRECVNIPEATASTYRLVTSEIGKAVRVVVTATNAAGATSVPSVATLEILEGPPVDLAAPTISGALEEGATLTAGTGTWVGTPPFTYTYQWRRCSLALEGCAALPGATEATYVPGAEEVGDDIELVVSAHNKADEAGVSATSPETAPVSGL